MRRVISLAVLIAMFTLGVSLAFAAHADLIIKSPADGSTVRLTQSLGEW